jgi:hypothetical protein
MKRLISKNDYKVPVTENRIDIREKIKEKLEQNLKEFNPYIDFNNYSGQYKTYNMRMTIQFDNSNILNAFILVPDGDVTWTMVHGAEILENDQILQVKDIPYSIIKNLVNDILKEG